MSITVDGNSFSWDGTVTLTNSTDLTTGVAHLLLTPSGGVGSLPVLAQGDPGLPPVIDSVTVTQIEAGVTPNPPVLTLVSPGGAGVASHYTLAIEVNRGAAGPSSSFTLAGATDLITGAPADQQVIKWSATDGAFRYAAQLCGDTYSTRTFTSYSGNATAATLATITVPAQQFNWRPRVSGQAIATGTSNTHVDLVCRVANATSGDQVGYGFGITGSGSTGVPSYPITLIQAFGSSTTGSYGVVSSGNSATFYFLAVQTAATTDAWSVSDATCNFSVKVEPIPGTNG